jgi:hypothetical protein
VAVAAAVLIVTLSASGSGAPATPAQAPAGGEVVYSDRPADLHGLPVAVFESFAIAEFGGEVPHQPGGDVHLAAHPRAL